MNIDYLIDRINDRGFEVVYIFQGSVKEIKQEMNEHPVYVIEKGSNYGEQLKKFQQHWPGQYTAFLRKNSSAPYNTCERVQFSTTLQNVSNTVLEAQLINGTGYAPDIETLKKQIRAEMQYEFELKNFQNEMAMMRAEMGRMNAPEERLAKVGIQIMERLKWIPPVNGNTVATEFKPVNGTENNEVNDDVELTDEQAEQLESDVAILVHHLGLHKIHQIATKMDADPNVVAMIKTYL